MHINAVGKATAQIASALNNLEQYLQAQSISSGSGGVSLELSTYSRRENEFFSIWIPNIEEIFTART